MARKDIYSLIVFSLAILVLLIVLYLFELIDVAQAIQIILTFTLVCVTAVYVRRTAEIAKANEKMAEEMREQRIMESKPVIIQKVIVETETEFRTFGSKDWFSYFEIYNAGNGPAIEIETALLNKDKSLQEGHRETFLRASELIEFTPSTLSSEEEDTFYLVSEYRDILSLGLSQVWYQTWLPFKTVRASEEGKIYIIAGELEFREISEKERVTAFGSGSKPK